MRCYINVHIHHISIILLLVQLHNVFVIKFDVVSDTHCQEWSPGLMIYIIVTWFAQANFEMIFLLVDK